MRSACFLFLALGLLQTAMAQAPAANTVDVLLSRGIAAQQQHDYPTAIESYRKALALRPGLAEARANLGVALAAVGQFDEAIAEDIRALAVAPNKNAVRMNLALAYYKKGDMDHARVEFETIHAARPRDLSVAVLLGYVYLKLNKETLAVNLLTPFEPGHKGNMDLEYVLGYAMIQSGNSAAGVPRMERVAQATRSAEAYVIAGSVHLHKREFRDARIDLDKAIELDSSFPGANTLAGQARDAMGDTDAAQPAFEAALRQDPNDFTANLYLGTMRLKQRNFEQARPLLELAVKLQPTAPQARFQLAKLNSLTDRRIEAAATLEDLEKNDPKWLDPHVELATIYYKLNRPEDGLRERKIVEELEAHQQKEGPAN